MLLLTLQNSKKGRLAQLVQSTCLTSRGSQVRALYLPRKWRLRSPFFMQYFVYILYSETLDKYYVGSTQDLAERLRRHNEGRNKSTKAGIPWKRVYQESYSDRSAAYRKEREIKARKSRMYIEDLIEGIGY